MKAAIYNPYLDTLGGGERYSLGVAKYLLSKGYQVDLQWHSTDILPKLEDRFGMSFEGIRIIEDIKRGDGYDLCFWISDGSIPNLLSRKNILHFQIPFTNVGGRNLLNRMKMFRISSVVCNSNFTKSFIDKEFGINSKVVYPPVDINKFKSSTKKQTILFVGRFSTLKQAKRQDVLIEAFKKFYDQGFREWNLILAGGVEVGSDKYIEVLEKLKKGYPIKIVKSPSFKQLQELYSASSIFWSASGFNIDEKVHPESVEHFGISIIEAMAAKCIPLAYLAGGHKETITHGVNGYLWTTHNQLIDETKKIINTKGLMSKLQLKVRESAKNYSYDNFYSKLQEII